MSVRYEYHWRGRELYWEFINLTKERGKADPIVVARQSLRKRHVVERWASSDKLFEDVINAARIDSSCSAVCGR